MYYPNGNLQAKFYTKGGLRDGRAEFYHETGALKGINQFKAGQVEDGLNFGFNENGQHVKTKCCERRRCKVVPIETTTCE